VPNPPAGSSAVTSYGAVVRQANWYSMPG